MPFDEMAELTQHFHDLAAALAHGRGVNLCDAEGGNPDEVDASDLEVMHDSAIGYGAECVGLSSDDPGE